MPKSCSTGSSLFDPERTPPVGVQQVLLVTVRFDVGRENRADRYDFQAPVARRSETRADKRCTDVLSLMLRRDLSMREHDHAFGQRVLGNGDRIAKVDFKAVMFRIVADAPRDVRRIRTHTTCIMGKCRKAMAKYRARAAFLKLSFDQRRPRLS